MPAVHVSFDEFMVSTALFRLKNEDGRDLDRMSIDIMDEDTIRAVLTELEISDREIYTYGYGQEKAFDVNRLIEFHLTKWKEKKIDFVLTSIGEWKISLYAAKTRRHAVLEVITEDGVRGFGEASPSPAFMGETADTVKLVTDLYLAPAVVGLPVSALSLIHERMNQAIYGNSAAKSALDIAVHDAWGKTVKQPVYELVGGLYRKKVPLTYVVGMKNTKNAYDEAMKRIDEGFNVIKIKVGQDPKRDVELVNLIRKAVDDSGKDVKIRLDANQGYDVPTAIRVIRELEEDGELESVEQPVRKWNVFGLKEICEKVKTPLMIDETVFGLEDVTNAIKLGIADIINLKICKVGGIHQAKKIAGMAEAAGMTCTIGSNLELGLGIAASAHVAVSTPVVNKPSDFICGIYLHDHDILQPSVIEFVEDGQMKLLSGTGLGVHVDEEILQKSSR